MNNDNTLRMFRTTPIPGGNFGFSGNQWEMAKGTYGNLLEFLPKDLKEEYFEDLIKCDGVRIERIVSKGQVSEEGFWYDQDEHEFVLVLQGAARLVLEQSGGGDGGMAGAETKGLDLKPGSWTFLPAHCRHRVVWTDPDVITVWLAVFWSPGTAPPHS